MSKRIRALAIFAAALSLTPFALAEQASQLRVSATVPPRPCEYPQTCDPVPQSAATMVSVEENGEIEYVGSPPAVTQTEGLMIIMF